METQQIVLDRDKALVLYKQYLTHREYQTPVDYEVQRTYHAIAKGKMVIKAIQSVIDAGVGEDGLPKLALCSASASFCHFVRMTDGGGRMTSTEVALWSSRPGAQRNLIFPPGTFPTYDWQRKRISGRAQVPTVPPQHRPKRGLANYHILFEAEWEPVPPRDPLLLRRIGKADLWVVLAAWDLTEVERAALSTRVHG